MRGKKGMSPLIATILLMAFAVALGAVIMNWSSTLPEGGPSCEAVTLTIREFCVEGSTLNIDLRNTGSEEVAQVALAIQDPALETQITLRNSRLGTGESIQTTIPFPYADAASVSIIPAIFENEEAAMCAEPARVFETVPSC